VVFIILFARLYDYTDVVTKGLLQQQTNVERAIKLVESIMDHTEAGTGKVINYALELSRKYEITDIDTHYSAIS